MVSVETLYAEPELLKINEEFLDIMFLATTGQHTSEQVFKLMEMFQLDTPKLCGQTTDDR